MWLMSTVRVLTRSLRIVKREARAVSRITTPGRQQLQITLHADAYIMVIF